MNLLTIEHLTKAYTERKLFDDTDFSIQEGDKIGVIGINGTGKSTPVSYTHLDVYKRQVFAPELSGAW